MSRGTRAFVMCAAARSRTPAASPRRATCSASRLAPLAYGAASLAAAALVAIAPAAAMNDGEILVFDHDQTLVGSDFHGRQDLVGAIFSKANATRSDFSGTNLENAQLDDAVFIEAKLDGANCTNVLATKAKLQKASLRDVNFTNANLVAAQLGGADIEGADFSDALIEPAMQKKLCVKADGTNSKTGVSTRESLMCPL